MRIRIRPAHAMLLAGFALSVFSASTLSAQAGIGKRYGSREPHTCASRKGPANGTLTSAQAVEYFLCGYERESSNSLYLAANVRIEVSKPRPFNIRTDSFTGIDPSQKVFDIRGSFDGYQCNFIGNVNGTPGKNCTHTPQPNASGECYKDSFGDWNCVLSDTAVGPTRWEYNVAPPRN